MSICMMVTNDAMTTIKAGIRTLSGIRFLMSEITIFDMVNTAIVATPIPMPFMAEVVVPSVGHIPNTSTKVGLSLTIPRNMIFSLFIVASFLSIMALCCTRYAVGRFLRAACHLECLVGTGYGIGIGTRRDRRRRQGIYVTAILLDLKF